MISIASRMCFECRYKRRHLLLEVWSVIHYLQSMILGMIVLLSRVLIYTQNSSNQNLH